MRKVKRMYTPEEFAQSMKKRGLVNRIAEARQYVKGTGKESFDESDFEEAYRTINVRPIGREYKREAFVDDKYVYFKRSSNPKYSDYWVDEIREL